MNDIEECDIFDNTVENSIWVGLRNLYLENKCYDITLLTKDGEVSAHKVVLGSISRFFKYDLTYYAFLRIYPLQLVQFCCLQDTVDFRTHPQKYILN